MGTYDYSLISRLEQILDELECHFGYLVGDARVSEGNASPLSSETIDKLKFAKECIGAAVRTIGDPTVAGIVESNVTPAA